MTHCVSSSWKSQYNWTFSILGLQRGCLPRVLRARCAIILTRFCVLWPLQRSNRGCIFFCFFSARQKNTENHSQISPTDRHTIIAQSHPFFLTGEKLRNLRVLSSRILTPEQWPHQRVCGYFYNFVFLSLIVALFKFGLDHRYHNELDGVSFDGRNFACWSHEHLESIYPTRH